MRRSALLLAVLLTGCPTPPDEEGPGGPGGPGGQGGPGGGQGGPGGGGSQGVAPQGGNGDGQGAHAQGGGMDLSRLIPQQSQAEVEASTHVSIRGTVEGSCAGKLRIDAVDPATAMQGPATVKDLSGTGEYSMVVPKGGTYTINAMCDQDGDGIVRDREIGPSLELGQLTSDHDGALLRIDAVPDAEGSAAPGGEGAMGGPGGEGAMGPPGGAEGGPGGEQGPAGPPPDGQPGGPGAAPTPPGEGTAPQ